MLRRFRGKGQEVKKNPPGYDDFQEKVIIAEERFLKMFSPIESHIMSLQSLLVWENIERSAALLLGVNVLFWLATTMRIYYLIGMTGAIVTFVDLWRNYVWPEIRVPVPSGEDEEWIPVHPHLLSVPELCHHAAEHWVNISSHIQDIHTLRKQHHAKFFVKAVFIFLALACFGHYVPGMQLTYITVMSCMLWPCVIYHNLHRKCLEKIQPYFRDLEDSLKIKRTPGKKKGKKSGKKKKRGAEMPDATQEIDDSRSEDEDELKQFIPSPSGSHPHLTDSDSDADAGLLSPPPAVASRTPSRDDQLLNSDDESSMSLTPAVSQMPHFDQVDNSMADLQSLPNLSEITDEQLQSSNADLDFVPSHFQEEEDEMRREREKKKKKKSKKKKSEDYLDSDLDEEEDLEHHLASGLDMPDVDDSFHAEEQEVQQAQSSTAQAFMMAAATNAFQNSQVVSDTMTSLMSSTFSGLTQQLRNTVMSGTQLASSVHEEETGGDVVEAEFEFLSQEDLEDSLHEEDLREGSERDGRDGGAQN